MRDVGEMGESVVQNWSAQVGITANRVVRDRTGWDFILELPASDDWNIRGGALDTTPETVKCLVQVKATDGNKRSVSLSLSNLKSLVSASFPSFLLVLHFDDHDAPQRAYLIEMNASRAATVLKRIRELSRDKSRARVLRSTYSVRYGDQNSMKRMDGIGLQMAISAATGSDMASYVGAKHRWLATVGYENGHTQANVAFRLPEGANHGAEAMVDLTLGLRSELEMLSCVLVDVRFGIPAPKALAVLGAGSIRVNDRKPVAKAVLRFRDAHGIEVDVCGDAFVPFGLGPAPDERLLKVRVESPHMEVVFAPLSPEECKVTLRLVGGDEVCDLGELRAASEAMLMWMRPGGAGEEVGDMELVVDQHQFFSAKLLGVGEGDSDAVHRSQAAVNAWKVASYMGLVAGCRVRPEVLFQQANELEIFAGVIGPDIESQVIEVGVDDGFCKPGDELCAPLAMPVKIGEYTCVVAGAVFGAAVELGRPESRHTHTLVRKRFRVLHKFLLRPGEKKSLRRNDLLDEVADAFKDEAKVVRWWDPNA